MLGLKNIKMMNGSITRFISVHAASHFARFIFVCHVDKHGLNKFSMLALEDTIFKVEVHILRSLFLSATHFFKNMSIVTLAAPDRTNRTEGLEASKVQMRRPEASISWARERVPMQYVFLAYYSKDEHEASVASPLNLPPRYKEFERGRVLVSFKRDLEQEQQPVVLDSLLMLKKFLLMEFLCDPRRV